MHGLAFVNSLGVDVSSTFTALTYLTCMFGCTKHMSPFGGYY